MMNSAKEVLEYVEEHGVKFIRLAFFDVLGVQHNLSIMPHSLEEAFEKGVRIQASMLDGFYCENEPDLIAVPDPSTMVALPWRSMDNGVILMICDLQRPDGSLFERDCRQLLKKALMRSWSMDLHLTMAADYSFYLFSKDEQGNLAKRPMDQGSYMDVSPADGGENIRRQICLTLDEMGLEPRQSFHQQGPGQNEIGFHFADPLAAADQAMLFKWVTAAAADTNGLSADFSAAPLEGHPQNRLRVFLQLGDLEDSKKEQFLAGILRLAGEFALFCNPETHQVQMECRPGLSCWSKASRKGLLRWPDRQAPIEFNGAQCASNPYLLFALLIEAGLQGISQKMALPAAFERPAAPLPVPSGSMEAAAERSAFVHRVVPVPVVQFYARRSRQ